MTIPLRTVSRLRSPFPVTFKKLQTDIFIYKNYKCWWLYKSLSFIIFISTFTAC